MSGEMDIKQRDNIIVIVRKSYELIGCSFPFEDVNELVEYLYESSHGDEIRCLSIAIEAHNLYNNDTMDADEFYEWHGL